MLAAWQLEASPDEKVLCRLRVDGTFRAGAGRVTPSDSPGFPITISQPGSYRLSGNLTVPPGAVGIVISVSNVVIDLNGFSLIGTPGTNGAGIAYVGPLPATGLAIRNGVIDGFLAPLSLGSTVPPGGFYATKGAEVMLKDLYINLGIPNLATGFNISGHSVVNNVVAGAYDLFMTTCPSSVSNSVFRSVSSGPPTNRCTVSNFATDF